VARASAGDKVGSAGKSVRTPGRCFFAKEGVSAVFTPALVEVRVNQYTSAGLAKGCQPQIFLGQ